MMTPLSKDGEASVRTFLAIELPPGIRESLAAIGRQLAGFSGIPKIVSPELMHLTVRFLGGVPTARLPLVEDAARSTVESIHPFSLSLSHIGTFPERGALPRVIWVGLQEDAGYTALGRLFAALEGALAARGFERERRAFSPHLTLARVREDAPRQAVRELGEAVRKLRMASDAARSFDVTALTVMRSDLSPRGPRYTPLVHAPLAGVEAVHR